MIKFEVYVVIDFIFIRKNYAFIRELYLLSQFTYKFVMNEFMKCPQGYIHLLYLFIYLFIRKLYLLDVIRLFVSYINYLYFLQIIYF